MSGENKVFQWVLSWFVLITILVFANRTRLGHVIIYYSLLLMILVILVTEYATLAPIFGNVQTVGQLNNSLYSSNGSNNS